MSEPNNPTTPLRVVKMQHEPSPPTTPTSARLPSRLVRGLDRLFNRIYGSRWNPLYQSGTLAVLFLLVTTLSGLYLFLFYKVSDPYLSVQHTVDNVWLGNWMRSMHRYAGDLAIVAVLVHAIKMFVAGRNWGPRALAWIAGLGLFAFMLFCGWTGFIMVWDVQGQLLAVEMAALLDALPLFSEPIGRMFTGEAPLTDSFFFFNLFLHVALPLGLVFGLWLHVSRVARPRLLPPRKITWYALGALALYAWLVPAPMLAAADPTKILGEVTIDIFYGFWLPAARALPAVATLLLGLTIAVVMVTAPWWWRPKQPLEPSQVNVDLCTGCSQCYEDCPYDAITMVPRTEPSKLSDFVALVDPDLCVSCGICAASCAPMGVGPPGRTGRDQLRRAQVAVSTLQPTGAEIVLFACRNGLGPDENLTEFDGVLPVEIGCAGALHTSIIELYLRKGVGGAYILACPERDSQYREGPIWLHERLYNDREAELKDRVDKRRVRVGLYGPAEVVQARDDILRFRDEIRRRLNVEAEDHVEIDFDCDPPQEVPGVG